MSIVHQLQDRAASVIGITPGQRAQRLDSLYRPPHGDAAGYWLQLSISALIATLGLAQNSAAVVIGAMLIAPLMQPIIELGFGLAIGSPLLMFRSAARFAGSVILTLLASAAITRALPFHELTGELLARTSPTMLDLFIAGACALAAVYTTVRSSGETASAAAGTAIGISLVPPLCTAGWGLGNNDWEVARGAALLFTANFTAIIVLTAVCVLGLGFGQYNLAAESAAFNAEGPVPAVRRAAQASERVFGRRVWVLARVLLPATLLAMIYLPLRAALGQVAWQSSARADISAALAPYQQRMVPQSIEIRHGQIQLGIIAIGDRVTNQESLEQLTAEIQRRTGVVPRIRAMYVPDADALADLASSMSAPAPAPPPPPPPPDPPGPALVSALRQGIAERWPASAGILLDSRVVFAEPVVIEMIHLGAELGLPAREMLAADLGGELGLTVVVAEWALPVEARAAATPAQTEQLADWLVTTVAALDVAAASGVAACVEVPAAPQPARRRPPPDPQRDLTRTVLRIRLSSMPRSELLETDRWAVRFTQDDCTP